MSPVLDLLDQCGLLAAPGRQLSAAQAGNGLGIVEPLTGPVELLLFVQLSAQQCVDVQVGPDGEVRRDPTGERDSQLGMKPGSAGAAALALD